jgi:uncharacterized protein with PQ loop repeat
MLPSHVKPPSKEDEGAPLLRKAIGAMSVFTLLMTIPQVWTIWVAHEAAGVSLASWAAYLVSALLWFAYGLSKRDRNIYLPCIGWISLDAAVVLGVVLYG